MQNFLEYFSYIVTIIILLSVFVEGRYTRFPNLFFYGSLALFITLLIISICNWFFFDSSYGLLVAGFGLGTLIITRFRLIIYHFQYKALVKYIGTRVNSGFRVILILPEEDEEKKSLLNSLSVSPKLMNRLFVTYGALSPAASGLCSDLSTLNREKKSYLLVCDGQLIGRSWLPLVENDEPATAIAINFHHLPDYDN